MHHRQQRAYDRAAGGAALARAAAAGGERGARRHHGASASSAATRRRCWRGSASRSPAGAGGRRTIAGVETFHGADELDAFLARTDILVSLLPLTPETRGILAMPLFGKLARDGALGGPVLINAGRGGLQVEADIVAALDDGRARAAPASTCSRPSRCRRRARSGRIRERRRSRRTAAAWSAPEALVPPMLGADRGATRRGEPLAERRRSRRAAIDGPAFAGTANARSSRRTPVGWPSCRRSARRPRRAAR